MELFIIVVLVIALAASVYANYNMSKKNEAMEDRVVLMESFIQEFSNSLSIIDKQLKAIDTRGTFEADDEVGYTFKAITLITSQLQQFNTNYAEKKEE